jgi:hypothetical protein
VSALIASVSVGSRSVGSHTAAIASVFVPLRFTSPVDARPVIVSRVIVPPEAVEVPAMVIAGFASDEIRRC